MSSVNDGALTQLLRRAGDGDAEAMAEAFPVVYGELRRIAHNCLSNARPDQTLRTTALINEVYLRLSGGSVSPNDRVHFFAIAARAMRMILVDYVRRQTRQKRGGGGAVVTLDENTVVAMVNENLLLLDEGLHRLAAIDARKARAVELHYFAGLSYVEISMELGLSEATVHRDLQFAIAWLTRELTRPAGTAP